MVILRIMLIEFYDAGSFVLEYFGKALEIDFLCGCKKSLWMSQTLATCALYSSIRC